MGVGEENQRCSLRKALDDISCCLCLELGNLFFEFTVLKEYILQVSVIQEKGKGSIKLVACKS
jgi:hypothetical protein